MSLREIRAADALRARPSPPQPNDAPQLRPEPHERDLRNIPRFAHFVVRPDHTKSLGRPSRHTRDPPRRFSRGGRRRLPRRVPRRTGLAANRVGAAVVAAPPRRRRRRAASTSPSLSPFSSASASARRPAARAQQQPAVEPVHGRRRNVSASASFAHSDTTCRGNRERGVAAADTNRRSQGTPRRKIKHARVTW